MPLIAHAGDEKAVHGFGEHLGNPLLLRRPLDAGVRVVVAHCASLGDGEDLDRPGSGARPSNFDLFARLMDEPRYRDQLVGDLSAVVQFNRVQVIATLLARRDWHARLLNGSDYPLPGVVPLVNLRDLAARGLIGADAVEMMNALRKVNVLLFDFVLKRSLAAMARASQPGCSRPRPSSHRGRDRRPQRDAGTRTYALANAIPRCRGISPNRI